MRDGTWHRESGCFDQEELEIEPSEFPRVSGPTTPDREFALHALSVIVDLILEKPPLPVSRRSQNKKPLEPWEVAVPERESTLPELPPLPHNGEMWSPCQCGGNIWAVRDWRQSYWFMICRTCRREYWY